MQLSAHRIQKNSVVLVGRFGVEVTVRMQNGGLGIMPDEILWSPLGSQRREGRTFIRPGYCVARYGSMNAGTSGRSAPVLAAVPLCWDYCALEIDYDETYQHSWFTTLATDNGLSAEPPLWCMKTAALEAKNDRTLLSRAPWVPLAQIEYGCVRSLGLRNTIWLNANWVAIRCFEVGLEED